MCIYVPVIIAVRNDFFFRGFFVEPSFPLLLISRYLLQNAYVRGVGEGGGMGRGGGEGGGMGRGGRRKVRQRAKGNNNRWSQLKGNLETDVSKFSKL